MARDRAVRPLRLTNWLELAETVKMDGILGKSVSDFSKGHTYDRKICYLFSVTLRLPNGH
jgi:hypothetical protein